MVTVDVCHHIHTLVFSALSPVPPCALHRVPGGVGETREEEDPDYACKGLAVQLGNSRSHTRLMRESGDHHSN